MNMPKNSQEALRILKKTLERLSCEKNNLSDQELLALQFTDDDIANALLPKLNLDDKEKEK